MSALLFDAPPKRGQDALIRRIRAELGVGVDWATTNGVPLVAAEIGIPNDESPTRWNRALDAWLKEAKRRGIGSFYWDARELFGTYKLAAFTSAVSGSAVSVAKSQAPVVRKFRSNGSVRRGVYCTDGLQNTPYQGEATSTFSNLALGTHGTDYQYPGAATFAYLRAQGIDTVAIGFRWERLQPTLGAAFNATESTRLQTSVSAAIAAGLSVVLQPFNKGSYYLDVTGTGTRFDIGSATVTQAHFNDLWSRISTLYKNTAGVVAYGLMNEPFIDPSAWETISQATVTAIRALPDTKQLWVPGSANYTLPEFGYAHPVAWISGGGDILYEAHQYFDGPPMAGAYGLTYAQQLAAVAVPYTDTFNRADAASLGTASDGGEWFSSNLGISGNRAYPTASVGTYAQATRRCPHPYGTLRATFHTLGGDESHLVREAHYHDGTSRIYRWRFGAVGSEWVLDFSSPTGGTTWAFNGGPVPASGDVPEMVFRPGSVTCKVNGVAIHTRTNADVGWGTRFGLAFWQGGTSRTDDWSFTPDYAGG